MNYCQDKSVFYIDTVKEPWEGTYSNPELELSKRTNYQLREQMLNDVKKKNKKQTVVSCCGANPGMVSWLVKQALLNMAKDINYPLHETPSSRGEWGLLMKNLGVKGLHIAERDTQNSGKIRP
jgi:homospermidine synthase